FQKETAESKSVGDRMDALVWKKCNSCKGDIPYQGKYFTCSVSSCNQKPFNYVFCSVSCFERHLPGARHKDAAAINEVAPKYQAASQSSVAATSSAPNRRIVSPTPSTSSSTANQNLPNDILIVVS